MKNSITSVLLPALLLAACCRSQEGVMQMSDYLPEQTIEIVVDEEGRQLDSYLNQIKEVNLIPLEYSKSFLLSTSLPETRVSDEAIYFRRTRGSIFRIRP